LILQSLSSPNDFQVLLFNVFVYLAKSSKNIIIRVLIIELYKY
jgi:hypothetical protein